MARHRGREAQRWIAGILIAVVAAVSLVAIESSPPAQAAVASEFDPSYIISDLYFYDANAMSEAEIVGFLQARIGECQNENCLTVVKTNTTSRVPDQMCNGYQGADGETTASIIYQVQQSCGISAKVLLVTLQKEQSLVTNRGPTTATLDRAMGYACPDDPAKPGWCDPAYGGLYNQIFRAAWQFKRYSNPSGTSNYFTWYPVGGYSNVKYHPNDACGSSSLAIRNRATAALYYYTPYQPNSAALGNLYGTGDPCSSYGNRNFWRLYSDWFGSPTGSSLSPLGNFEVASASVDSAHFRGWAFDPEAADSITIHMYINNQWGGAFAASMPRPDVAVAYPSYGANHGFDFSVPIEDAATSFIACLYAINVGFGDNVNLGCRLLQKPTGPPIGNIDSAVRDGTTLTVAGWALDPDTSAPIQVATEINGVRTAVFAATASRSDVGLAYPGYGNAHGFNFDVQVPVGTNDFCVIGLNVRGGNDSSIGCKTISTATGPPIGNIDSASLMVPGRVTISGWVLDPDTSAPIDVHVYVDGRWGGSFPAGQERGDIARAFPGYGSAHGYSFELGVPGGRSKVCVYGINVLNGYNSLVSCSTVIGPTGSPFGNSESAALTQAGAVVTGWAIDPDSNQSIDVHVYVNGQWGGSYTADSVRPDVGAAYPIYGAAHGFAIPLVLAHGQNNICVYPINVGPGANGALSCRLVNF